MKLPLFRGTIFQWFCFRLSEASSTPFKEYSSPPLDDHFPSIYNGTTMSGVFILGQANEH